MTKSILVLTLTFLAPLSAFSAAKEDLTVPARSSQYLLETMADNGNFEEGTGSLVAYNGYVHCGESYADPGNHASAIPYCELLIKKEDSSGILLREKTSNWISKKMQDSDEFEEGTDGVPGTSYNGYLQCEMYYTDPGNHASGKATCVLSNQKNW